MKPDPLDDTIEAAAAQWVARSDVGLTADEQAEFEHWREADSRHARAFARHAHAWTILDRPARGGRAKTMVMELNQRARVRRLRRVMAAAVCSVVLLTASLIWRMQPDSPSAPSGPSAPTSVVIQPEKRLLPDGSTIELKAGAEIDVAFDHLTRGIILKKGEAHFQVVKNTERPFIVRVGRVAFRAVGTAFSVQLSPTQVEVLVTEGRVAVEKNGERILATQPAVPAKSAPEQVATVDAGNLLLVELAPTSSAAAPRSVAVAANEISKRLAWRTARIEFTGTPLAEAVALLNKYNRVQFVVADPVLAKIEVSGFFRADNTDAFLILLEGSLGVKARRSGDTIALGIGP